MKTNKVIRPGRRSQDLDSYTHIEPHYRTYYSIERRYRIVWGSCGVRYRREGAQQKSKSAHRHRRCDAIRFCSLSAPARRRDRPCREISLAKKSHETLGCYRTWLKTPESSDTPFNITSGETSSRSAVCRRKGQ